MTRTAVRCSGLSKSFGAQAAVRDLVLGVPHGKTLTILGPSGCGKTTTLRLIAGFETPDAGTIDIDGRIVAGPGSWTPPERRRVGLVFQDFALFPHLSVSDNIAFGLGRCPERRQRIADVLALVHMEGMGDRMPHQLSGGQQQRVALARALAPKPDVLLMDEPFSNLDATLRARVREDVRQILRDSGVTAIMVTHAQEEALFMGDLVAVMRDGALGQVGTPEEVFHAPASTFVASFMGAADFLPAQVLGKTIRTELGDATTPEGANTASKVLVMVRPDDVEIAPAHDGESVVVDRVFQGSFYEYHVRLPSGAVVRSLQLHTRSWPVGARVHAMFHPAHEPRCFVDGRLAAPREVAEGKAAIA